VQVFLRELGDAMVAPLIVGAVLGTIQLSMKLTELGCSINAAEGSLGTKIDTTSEAVRTSLCAEIKSLDPQLEGLLMSVKELQTSIKELGQSW
jgi:hypothetical protein